MKTLCVYCGSNAGNDPRYAAAAVSLGKRIAAEGMGLIYGGGNVGLMGIVADAVLEAGGEVIGVIPEHLVRYEVAHKGLTRLEVVGSMHERKARMAELSDGFVAMPGGIGTYEEIFEIWTWAQLGIHTKPLGFYNLDGFYDGLLAFMDKATEDGFVRQTHRHMAVVADRPGALLDKFAQYVPVATPKWITPAQS